MNITLPYLDSNRGRLVPKQKEFGKFVEDVCGLRLIPVVWGHAIPGVEGRSYRPGQGVLRNQAGCCGCSQAHPGDQEAGGGLHRCSHCRLRVDPAPTSVLPPKSLPFILHTGLSLSSSPHAGETVSVSRGAVSPLVCVSSAFDKSDPCPQVTCPDLIPLWDTRQHFTSLPSDS